jgi:hypothetical protein
MLLVAGGAIMPRHAKLRSKFSPGKKIGVKTKQMAT